MSKIQKYFLLLLVSSLLIFYYVSTKPKILIYHSKDFELTFEEYGVMLINRFNSGEYAVRKVYKNNDEYILELYQFQGKKKKWVILQENYLIDRSFQEINFSNYTEISPKEIL
jgi:hypothetical protein